MRWHNHMWFLKVPLQRSLFVFLFFPLSFSSFSFFTFTLGCCFQMTNVISPRKQMCCVMCDLTVIYTENLLIHRPSNNSSSAIKKHVFFFFNYSRINLS